MRRRPVARVSTGVAVAAVALTSVFAGTAWAPKALTGPAPEPTKVQCRAELPARFDTYHECIVASNRALKALKDLNKAN
jgi:hypothetical protein